MPLRDGHSGKSRLADHLSPEQRRDVVAALVEHVVSTLLGARIGRVFVVTNDPEFARLALPFDPRVEVVRQPADRPGLNAAVTLANELAMKEGAERLLVVHADLPLLDAEDVHALLGQTAPLILAPDHAQTGTNALVLDTAIHGFRFRFGEGSCAAHMREAAQRGMPVQVVQRPGTAADLDTAADWAALPDHVRSRLRFQPSGDRAR